MCGNYEADIVILPVHLAGAFRLCHDAKTGIGHE